jgi:hypothetical protein
MDTDYILAVKISERNDNAAAVQKILTGHGCEIRARLGLPQQERNSCTDAGLLILHIISDEKTMIKMCAELNSIGSVSAKYMDL